MSEASPKLNIKVLKHVESTQLFYPASARDYLAPIEMFAPHVKDFWFADIAYFGQDDMLGDAPVLSLDQGYKLLDLRVNDKIVPDEQWKDDPKYLHGPPCVRTEEYSYLDSKQRIQIHFYRRRGCTALRRDIDRLGVFFYRRDSNEGGSGTLWFPNHVNDIFEKLIDGGLIVTDGSNCCHNTYAPLRRFRGESIGARARRNGSSIY